MYSYHNEWCMLTLIYAFVYCCFVCTYFCGCDCWVQGLVVVLELWARIWHLTVPRNHSIKCPTEKTDSSCLSMRFKCKPHAWLMLLRLLMLLSYPRHIIFFMSDFILFYFVLFLFSLVYYFNVVLKTMATLTRLTPLLHISKCTT